MPIKKKAQQTQAVVDVIFSNDKRIRNVINVNQHIDNKHEFDSKIYNITLDRASGSKISFNITINHGSAAAIVLAREKHKKHQNEMQARLDQIVATITKFETDVISDQIFEDAIENNGVDIVTLIHDKARLKLEIDNLQKAEFKYDIQTDMFHRTIQIGSCYAIADMVIYSYYDSPDSAWEHKTTIETKIGEQMLKPDQRVLAKYKTHEGYYGALITSANDNGTYALKFDDGHIDKNALRSNIIVDIKVDFVHLEQRVLARRTSTKFFHAIIKSVNVDGTYNVLYDDETYRKSVPLFKIRLI